MPCLCLALPLGSGLVHGLLDITLIVRFILRHLSATHHVLHELTRAFHCKGREARSRIDDVFHRSRHLASGFQADLVRTCRHLGDSITDVLTAVSRSAAGRRCYRGTGDYRGGGRSFRGVGWTGVAQLAGLVIEMGTEAGATGERKLRRVSGAYATRTAKKNGVQSA